MIKAELVVVLVLFFLKFQIWFLIHPYKISGLNSSITAAQGHWVMETSGFLNFLTLNTRFMLHLICLFARNHCGFDFYQVASIMIFNFLNSNLCAVILKDWVMITLFCTCLFHWWIWSSRFFVSDLISFIFILGLNFLVIHFVLYNFCMFVFSEQ